MATLTVKLNKRTNRIRVTLRPTGEGPQVTDYNFPTKEEADAAMRRIAHWALDTSMDSSPNPKGSR